MSTGAVVNPAGVGGAAAGAATTPIGQGARPLTSDAVFRIEVSLSSRKSSAIVMKTTARLYSLEGATPAVPGASPGKDAEWKPVAYGAPCIQLMRESTKHNCPFHIKIVIAEVESGISLWELEVDRSSQYNAMQTNFHTFSVGGKTYAVQFANDNEAERMLESIIDLFEQKEKAETVSFEKKPEEPIFKKPRSIRKLNKKDISTPCNFKHVSGITLQRTQTCEEELRGTIQRKMRSMSLSSLSRRKVRQEGGKTAAPNGVGVANAARGNASLERGQSEFRGLDVSPMITRKAAAKDSPKVGRSNSILNKFGSLRLTKKKPYSQVGPKGENGQSSSTTTDGQFVRDKNRMSLPSHYRQQSRPPLTGDLFDRRPLNDQNGQPVKALSRSSDNLADPRATSNPNPSISRDSVSSPTRKAVTLDRRHTFVAPTSPLHKGSPGPSQFNYTPYSRSAAAAANQNQTQQQQQQFQQLNRGVPYNYGRSATLDTHSAQYFQQQMRPYAAPSMQAQSGGGSGNLAGVSGRLHMSDMGLQRTGLTNQTGYQGGGGGYGPPSGGVAAVGAGQGKRRLSMNEMHLMSMDGVGGGSGNIIRQMPPQATSAANNRPQRMSFDGGIPAHQQAQYFQQQKSPVVTNGPMQQYQPYPQPPGPPSQGGAGQIHQEGMPLPPSQGPAGPITMSTTLPPQPNSSMTVTPTSANGYYPPTATAGQIQGYPPPPPGLVSTPRVMSAPQSNPGVISAPQQQQYPMQDGVSGASAPNSSNNVSTGTRKHGDPLPYATVQVSETSPPHHHNYQAGQTSQTSGTRTSPGRGGTGRGGEAVLSKLPTSPSRQASVTHSSTGNRPREVVTVSSPSAVSGRSPYDQLPTQWSRNNGMPQQQPMVGGAYPSYQLQGNASCAPLMAAPPPTKFTNLQLHQQYHQQYMRLQKQGSKTTPYHAPTSGRPTIQQYQEYQQKQQRERPPVAPKKSPPKQHQSSHSQPHPHAGHGQSLQYSPHHQHNQGPQLGGMPILHRQQFQPNNAASSAYSSPSRPLHVQVNDTSANDRGELVPKSNTGGGAPTRHDQQPISSPQGKQFAPQSTQAYDTLPAESDSLTNLDGTLASVTDELDRFTEEMSKALEQFDSLLQPQTSKPLKQSAL